MLAHVVLLSFCMGTKVARRNIVRRRNPDAGAGETLNTRLVCSAHKAQPMLQLSSSKKTTTIFLRWFTDLPVSFRLRGTGRIFAGLDSPEEGAHYDSVARSNSRCR